jgi:methylenetetrahydrofolate dehydrogenase (NADP+)/methenyltetrahydrofolate cyclohydrolase
VILDSDTTQQQLLNTVFGLNQDVNVDGILIQLPLYEQLSSEEVLEAVDPSKDVDGFHPRNVGRLWSGEPGLVPATPLGLIRILDHFCIPIEGQHVVIIGRSNLVGKPAAALFLHRHATVTLAHSKTRDLPLLTRQADILVAGAGRAGIVTKEWVKDGATILDVGQSLVGGNILGDVDPAVAEVAAAMTPTPGGTGPMTVAMVIHNTVEAARSRRAAID